MTNKQVAAANSLRLYSRRGCHLCEDMEKALADLQLELDFRFESIDIDRDPVLVKAYGSLVPVLMGEEGEICHYFLDPQALRAHLANRPNQL